MASVHTVRGLQPSMLVVSRQGTVLQSWELCARKPHFHPTNIWETNCGYADIEGFVIIFSKMSEVILSISKKQLAVFAVDDKIWAFKKKKMETLQNLCDLDSLLALTGFSGDMGGEIDPGNFFDSTKCITFGRSA